MAAPIGKSPIAIRRRDNLGVLAGSNEDGSQRAALSDTFTCSHGMWALMGTPVSAEDTLILRRRRMQERRSLLKSGASAMGNTKELVWPPPEPLSRSRTPLPSGYNEDMLYTFADPNEYRPSGHVLQRVESVPDMLDLCESKGIHAPFVRKKHPYWQPLGAQCASQRHDTAGASSSSQQQQQQQGSSAASQPGSPPKTPAQPRGPLPSLVPELVDMIARRSHVVPRGPSRLPYSPSVPVLIGGRLQSGWQYK